MMFVYSSFKMEGDSAVRGYHDAQINRINTREQRAIFSLVEAGPIYYC